MQEIYREFHSDEGSDVERKLAPKRESEVFRHFLQQCISQNNLGDYMLETEFLAMYIKFRTEVVMLKHQKLRWEDELYGLPLYECGYHVDRANRRMWPLNSNRFVVGNWIVRTDHYDDFKSPGDGSH